MQCKVLKVINNLILFGIKCFVYSGLSVNDEKKDRADGHLLLADGR